MDRARHKVEWHPGALYPRVGFIVTNMSRPAERVVAFYNKRGSCEQWIKEGKGGIKWRRLSCRSFCVRLLGRFLQRKAAAGIPVEQFGHDRRDSCADRDVLLTVRADDVAVAERRLRF